MVVHLSTTMCTIRVVIHSQIMTKMGLAFVVIPLLVGCDESYGSRPPFANRYGRHPEGFHKRWWVFPANLDNTGTSFRTDNELNIVILYIATDRNIYLHPCYPRTRVLDHEGNLLLRNQNTQKNVAIPNTPDILAGHNRLFAVLRDGTWREFEIPTDFAKGLDERYQGGRDIFVLKEIRKFSAEHGVSDLTQWLDEEVTHLQE